MTRQSLHKLDDAESVKLPPLNRINTKMSVMTSKGMQAVGQDYRKCHLLFYFVMHEHLEVLAKCLEVHEASCIVLGTIVR